MFTVLVFKLPVSVLLVGKILEFRSSVIEEFEKIFKVRIDTLFLEMSDCSLRG